jgi:small subunit ribosomal protein S5
MVLPTAELEFEERVAALNPVSKVHKGGRTRRWCALVVVGDRQGRVGVGLGKSADVPEAIRKGAERARKQMITVPLYKTTIPHEVQCRFSAAEVLLRPAAEGTGVIAGGAVRHVVEAAGIRDILTKSLGSANQLNVAKATLKALARLQTPLSVAERRGKKPEDLGVSLEGYRYPQAEPQGEPAAAAQAQASEEKREQ